MRLTPFTREQKIEIVCEQIRDKLTTEQIFIKYGVKTSTFYYWKQMFFNKTSSETLEQRMSAELVHPRVELRGALKNHFIKDCYIRDWQQGRLLHHIVDVYYSIMSNRPDMQGKEMSEIKKYINDKIKL